MKLGLFAQQYCLPACLSVCVSVKYLAFIWNNAVVLFVSVDGNYCTFHDSEKQARTRMKKKIKRRATNK